MLSEGNLLLGKIVESEVISRLAENEDISEWVEQGIYIHNKHSSDVCGTLYKRFPLTTEQLARHFNEADKKLKDDLDGLVGKLAKLYTVIQDSEIPDRARFYKELQDSFDAKKADFESAKLQILSDITKLSEEFKTKKAKPQKF